MLLSAQAAVAPWERWLPSSSTPLILTLALTCASCQRVAGLESNAHGTKVARNGPRRSAALTLGHATDH